MYVIVDGYAYFVDGSTGKKVSFDVNGQMNIDDSDTISITTQHKYSYDEMIRKTNAALSINKQQKDYIIENGDPNDLSFFYDNISESFKENKSGLKNFEKVVEKTVEKIENNILYTITVAGSTASAAELLGIYSASDLATITVNKKTISVTSNYVTEYTTFSGKPSEQSGYYGAFVITATTETGGTAVSSVKAQLDDHKLYLVDPADNTIIFQLGKNETSLPTKMTIYAYDKDNKLLDSEEFKLNITPNTED